MTAELILFGLSAGVIMTAMILLWRLERVKAGFLALGLWLVAALPSCVALTQGYVWNSPRLTYPPSIGIALFWGIVAASLLAVFTRPVLRFGLLLIMGAMFIWCGQYIAAYLNETARLTPALKLIDSDVRTSDPSARLLLINSSF